MQLGLSLDPSRCSGCMSCVVACLDQNDETGDGPAFRNVTRYEKGNYPETRISFLSISCFHCGDAPCRMVCPTNAIYRRPGDGIVDVNQDLCIGCHSCALACSFGAPHYDAKGKMSKCHLCATRVDAGLDPACVQACPTRALSYGPLEQLSTQKADKASREILAARVC
jgi:anaerobic dimethyl sulfoxide reductase subunit B